MVEIRWSSVAETSR